MVVGEGDRICWVGELLLVDNYDGTRWHGSDPRVKLWSEVNSFKLQKMGRDLDLLDYSPCMPVQNVKRSNSSSAKPDGLTGARRCRFDLDTKVCGSGICSGACSGFLDGGDGAVAAVDVSCSVPRNVPSVSELDISKSGRRQQFVGK